MRVKYELDERDVTLLKDYKPSPCTGICDKRSELVCKDCPERIKWMQETGLPIRDAGLEEIAQNYWGIVQAREEEKRMQEELLEQQMQISRAVDSFIDLFTGSSSEFARNLIGVKKQPAVIQEGSTEAVSMVSPSHKVERITENLMESKEDTMNTLAQLGVISGLS